MPRRGAWRSKGDEGAAVSEVSERLAGLSPEKRALLVRRLRERAPADTSDDEALVSADLERRHAPFPLTPLQEAYWVGRDGAFALGRVATHSYMELEGELDIGRLERAWHVLIERHDMLRARFLPDGRQETLPSVAPYAIAVEDLRAESPETAAERLLEIRDRMSHAVFDPRRWPLFDLRAARLTRGRTRVFLGVDALIVDAWSVRILFEEWSRLYADPDAALPPVDITFRDYVLATEELERDSVYARARDYWRRRLPELPPAPALPLARAPAEIARPRFVRRTAELSAARWSRLQERARAAGMTPTAVALAAYADVLSIWSETSRFTLSVPGFNRRPLHPHVDRVVGEFASFTLLAVENEAHEPFAERARRHQRQLWDDLDHARYGGVRVLRDLARHQRAGEAPAMPVVFTSAPQGGEGGGVGAGLPEGPWRVIYVNNQSSQVWLDNHVSEREGGLVCDWDTVDDLFPPRLPEDLLEGYMRHLEHLADDDSWWERTWQEVAGELLPRWHREVEARANDTEAPIERARVQDAFFEQVAAAPEAAAVLGTGIALTYAELASEIAACRERLDEAGVRPGDRVGIVMEKGWEQIVAAFAVLEAGAAYSPLSADDPPARRRALLERVGVRAVLTQPRLSSVGGWPEEPVRVLQLERTGGRRHAAGLRHPPAGDPEDVALVLHTSGSTGEPRAVGLRHVGVVNALRDTLRTWEVTPRDRVLALTALHHDMSLFDVFGVLGAGGAVVLPDAAGRRDPAHWTALMGAHDVTVWNSVPAMMGMLLAYAEASDEGLAGRLRLAFLGGDWIPVTMPDRLRRLAPGVEVVSVGGPTETTLWNIWHRVGAVDPDARSIPYGRPIANTRYHVIGEGGVERPLWVPGQLWVSGIGVTPGYLDDEPASRAKRGAHPRSGEAMWATGDLGRRLPDGDIEFLGRRDLQVQIHGQRVELGEIESQLARHPHVEAAAVAAPEDGRGGRRLVAYVVPAGGDFDARALEADLRERLSPHMVPSRIVRLDALPLTRNGKVDRARLPDPSAPDPGGRADRPTPDGGRGREAPPEAPPEEPSVLAIVEEVLGERVEPEANLLEYGANSIDMVRIGNRLEARFGRRPAIDEIFRLQSARALAAWYGRAETMDDAPSGRPASAADRVAAKLASYRVALAPEAREAFKSRRAWLRSDLDSRARVALERPLAESELEAAVWRRRSHRRFALDPVGAEDFGGFLAGLRQLVVAGEPKRLYASPGGLYPTQVYLHVKPGRVEGVPGGAYYYHPLEHALVALSPGARVSRDVHVPFVNAPMYDEAAFSVFLVAPLDAIGPAYGERSLHFATLEAGVIAAALEAWAPRWNVGLCQIGDIRFDELRHMFALDEDHVFLHSLVGGRSSGGGPESRALPGRTEVEASARLMEQVRGLTQEQVRRMLAERGERDAS